MRMFSGVLAVAAALFVAGACGGSKSTGLLNKDAGTGGSAGTGGAGGSSGCKTSLDCSKSQVCDKTSGQCVDCLTANDCKSGDKCIGNVCRPPCTSDKDCTPLGLLCDTSKGACVQCIQSTDCSGTDFCASGVCKAQVCEPGKASCQGNGIATCNADGSSLGTPVPCGGTKVCVQLSGGPICEEPDAGTGGAGGTAGTGGTAGKGGTAGSGGAGGSSGGAGGTGGCSSGKTLCSGSCVDTQSDPNNCGGCGKVCASVHGVGTCASGKCTLACDAGFANCDGDPSNGCEASLSTNAHCGSCAVSCTGTTCGTSINASMSSQPPGWHFNGSAFYDAAAGSAVLTPATANSAGTAMYGTAVATDSFTATFDLQMSGGGATGADGMAFVWQTDGPTAVGAGGGAMGVAPLHGFGVEFDEVTNECGDGPNNHMGIDPLTGCLDSLNRQTLTSFTIATNLPVQLRNTGWHKCTVQVTKGETTVTLDGTTVFNAFSIPNFAAASYYFGFGGGTGGLFDRHEVRNVSIKFPSPHCL